MSDSELLDKNRQWLGKLAMTACFLSILPVQIEAAEVVEQGSVYKERVVTPEVEKIDRQRSVEVLEPMVVTGKETVARRLNPLLGTQVDPTYKSEFDKIEPVTVHTISRQDLDSVKFTDSYEVLNRVPGISSSRNIRWPNGGKGYTVNLMDGISVRDPLRGQVSDIESFDTDEIQRIEIIKGPASALYPSNAFGGVINVITKDAPEIPINRVWFEGGANEINHRLRGGGNTAGKIDNLGYRLSFNIWDVPSWREKTGKSREVGSGKFSYEFDAQSKLTFRGEFLHEENSTGTSLTEKQFNETPQQARKYRSYEETETMTFYLDYERMISDDGFLKASYGARNSKGFNFASFSAPADDNYLDMDGKVTYKHHVDFWNSYITAGVETINGNVNSKTYNENKANPLERADKVKQHYSIDKLMVSPFVQLEIAPLPWMHLTGGLRYDDITYDAHNKLTGKNTTKNYSLFSPKSGITLDLPYEQKFWFNYSFGFSPPSPSLLFTDRKANPNLRPELIENLEVGFRGSLIKDTLDYEVAYYNADVTDYVVDELIDSNKTISVNAGKVNLEGVETSLRFTPIKYIRFEVAHTFSINKYINFTDRRGSDLSGNRVKQMPEHSVNARVALMPVDKLNIELEINAQTEYFVHDNNTDPYGTYQRPTLLNLRTSYDIGSAELWLHAINLTDERVARVGAFSRDRTVKRSYSSIGESLTIYGGIAFKF
ncbi:MAG: TonB-dependent receptor [Methylococcales bacterium]|nr:TonB-dependent receptor [Methylococcales bacterium]